MKILAECMSIPEWLAYARFYDFGTIPPDRMVLHHTWKPTIASWRGFSTMHGMRRFYEGKGWSAGPHIYVAPDGIWLFTPMNEVGIHAGWGNANKEFLQSGYRDFRRLRWYSIGIEMVGNYERERPCGVIWDGSRAVMAALAMRFDRPIEDCISFHRDHTRSKTCPGSAVHHEWVYAEVAEWMQTMRMAPMLSYYAKDGAKIHQGPATHYPVAGSLEPGAIGVVDALVHGQWFNESKSGLWVHLASGLGFVRRDQLTLQGVEKDES